MDEEALAAYLLQMRELIDQHGLAVQATTGFNRRPVCYTVGLLEHDHPELVMYGMEFTLMTGLLNNMAHEVIDHGRRYEHGERVTTILQDDMALVPVQVTDHTDLVMVRALFPDPHPRPALQICWPDPQGRLQWEPGFDTTYDVPLLGAAPTEEGT